MIIVSGMHPRNAQVRTQSFEPGKEGNARKFRKHLRALGYNTVFVNDMKDFFQRYREATDRCATVCEHHVEGIAGYQLHGNGTRSGSMKGQHIKDSGTSFLEDAVEQAEKLVNKWSDSHKGIVIYRAIKLVRKVTKPTTEIVELS